MHNPDWQTLHAQAVQHHAQAFDAEAAHSEQAALLWRKALDCWGAVFRLDGFWHSLRDKGRLLEPSLFETDQPIEELKEALPTFLLEVHVSYILNELNRDSAVAKYHLDLIRNANLGQSEADHTRFRQAARQQIYKRRLNEALLAEQDEEKFQNAIYLAEPLHLLDPTEATSQFMLNIYLTWVRKYETEQLGIIQDNYPEYSEIVAKIESEEDEFEYIDYIEEIYADIRDDEDIQILQEEQAELIGDLEAMVLDALDYCDYPNKPSIRRMISQALYFVGRHYYTSREDYDIDLAISYMEQAVSVDPGNSAAEKFLDQLNEYDDWGN